MIIPKAFLRECMIHRMREFEVAALESIKNQSKLQAYLLSSVYADEDEIACDWLRKTYLDSDVSEVIQNAVDCGMPLNTVLKFAKEYLSQAEYDTIFKDYETVYNSTWHTPGQLDLYDGNACSETVMDQDGNKVYYDSDTNEWVFDGPGIRTVVDIKRWRELNDWEK